MKIAFPSSEFDDAVAAVCHGTASDEQVQALNELLRNNHAALDEYIIRLELHSYLASERDLFASAEPYQASAFIEPDQIVRRPNDLSDRSDERGRNKRRVWAIALAACLALLAIGLWSVRRFRSMERIFTTSKAVAMLNRTADAQWNQANEIPRLGAPLEPSRLRLEAGLAEVTFYSGARLIIEGPAEVQLISQNEAVCRRGRIVAEVPDQARGFRVKTPHAALTDMGSSFGLDVKDQITEVHVFKGNIQMDGGAQAPAQILRESSGALIENARAPRLIAARPALFASLFNLQARSAAADARRHDQWRRACKRLETDPSLLVHFDFENVDPAGWRLRNLGDQRAGVSDATIVGCQWTEGRWPGKRSLEFQSVSDRVRLNVPGEFEAITFAAWICVKGLDRKINSLFMCDGFQPGTVHWLIRNDGVPGLTVIGAEPRNYQIVAGPPVLTLDQFGTWLHLAVVLDGPAKQVVQYLNGVSVSQRPLKITPPFRLGAAELGNWNAKGFREDDPFMIRNFSGAMDEFCLFTRALSAEEIRTLYAQGKPQGDSLAVH